MSGRFLDTNLYVYVSPGGNSDILVYTCVTIACVSIYPLTSLRCVCVFFFLSLLNKHFALFNLHPIWPPKLARLFFKYPFFLKINAFRPIKAKRALWLALQQNKQTKHLFHAFFFCLCACEPLRAPLGCIASPTLQVTLFKVLF